MCKRQGIFQKLPKRDLSKTSQKISSEKKNKQKTYLCLFDSNAFRSQTAMSLYKMRYNDEETVSKQNIAYKDSRNYLLEIQI